VELSLFFELETADMSDAGVKRTFDQCVEQVMLADQLGYKGVMYTTLHDKIMRSIELLATKVMPKLK